ncbi:MAG: hypothetical protein FWF88_02350 [Peptococcaceae bacterium]|nr:hypothetical protein [Peptococcaceae bacterium]
MLQTIKPYVAPVAVFLIITFFLSLTTHFGFLADGSYRHDAGIFAYIGYAMENGRALYTEVWENKGPLLYLINMIGVSINYWHGIYFFEVIAFFVTLLFAYKTALVIVKNNRWVAVFAAAFSMLLLAVTLQGGNLSEEYALPFMSVALYFITKFYYNQWVLRIFEVILVGACFSAVFLLRANICAFFLAMILVTVFVLIRQKQGAVLLRTTVFVLVGMVLFLLPVLIYLIANNSLGKCIDDAYLNILGSYSQLPIMNVVVNVFDMIETTAETGTAFVAVVFIIAYLVCLWKKAIFDQRLKYMLGIAFLGLFLNLLANSLSGVNQMHYFMTFIPIMVIPAAWIFHAVYLFVEKNTQEHLAGLLTTGAVILFLSFNGLFIMSHDVFENVKNPFAIEPKPAAAYILNNSQPDDLVQVIGGDVTLNYQTKRLTASRHVHFAAGLFSQESVEVFANEIAEDIKDNIPKLVLFGSDSDYKRFKEAATFTDIEEFLQSYYEQQAVEFDFIVYKKT